MGAISRAIEYTESVAPYFHIYNIETGSDEHAVIISQEELTDEMPQVFYKRWIDDETDFENKESRDKSE